MWDRTAGRMGMGRVGCVGRDSGTEDSKGLKWIDVTVSVDVEYVRFNSGFDHAVGSIQRGLMGSWNAILLLIPNLHCVCSSSKQGVSMMMVNRAEG